MDREMTHQEEAHGGLKVDGERGHDDEELSGEDTVPGEET